jgi:hypothetical protein
MSAVQFNQFSNEVVASRIILGGASSSMISFSDAPAAPTDAADSQEQLIERIAQQNERTRAAVSHVLTPQQLKVFEEEQNAQLKMQSAQMRMMRAEAQAEGR